MSKKTKKITLATIAALSFLFISTQGCQKAVERPAKVDSKISNDLIDITKTADVNSQGHFQPEAQMNNSILLDKAISKVTDENLKVELKRSKERGQLTFKTEEGKVILIKVMHKSEIKDEDIRGKSFYTLETLKTGELSQNFFSKASLIITQNVSGSLATSMTATVSSEASVSSTAQVENNKPDDDLLFIVMVAIGFNSGVLEHDYTEYSEKKSVLILGKKPLNESTHIILTEVVN